jgi:glycosyltransferase involved in cell wall biosynthesis
MINIIVPVYNTATYLPQCLDSLVNQTYRDIEIICVNDGSTDNSPDILKAYAERDSRILVIHQENLGLSDARNKGLESARGEWVMFVDSDDCDTRFLLYYRFSQHLSFMERILILSGHEVQIYTIGLL